MLVICATMLKVIFNFKSPSIQFKRKYICKTKDLSVDINDTQIYLPILQKLTIQQRKMGKENDGSLENFKIISFGLAVFLLCIVLQINLTHARS